MSETRGVAPVPASTGSELTHDDGAGGTDDMTTPTGKRTTSPAFQFYPDAFLSSGHVQRMSLTERGAYITLLSYCWLENGLSTDLSKLAATLHVPVKQFERMWKNELAHCFVERNGRLHNDRLDRERKKQAAHKKNKSDAANARWEKNRNAPALQTPAPANAPAMLSVSDSVSDSVSKNTQTARRAPLIDQREHRNHAQCGRICLHASLFSEFVRRRNHDEADREIRDWALGVETDWSIGAFKYHEPGDPFAFWRAQYDTQWPSKAAEPKSKFADWKPKGAA